MFWLRKLHYGTDYLVKNKLGIKVNIVPAVLLSEFITACVRGTSFAKCKHVFHCSG